MMSDNQPIYVNAIGLYITNKPCTKPYRLGLASEVADADEWLMVTTVPTTDMAEATLWADWYMGPLLGRPLAEPEPNTKPTLARRTIIETCEEYKR